MWVKPLVRYGRLDLQRTSQNEPRPVDQRDSSSTERPIDKDAIAVDYKWFNETASLLERYFLAEQVRVATWHIEDQPSKGLS